MRKPNISPEREVQIRVEVGVNMELYSRRDDGFMPDWLPEAYDLIGIINGLRAEIEELENPTPSWPPAL